MRVGEEIEEVERGQTPAGRDQPIRVAREGYRITGQIRNALPRAAGHGVDHLAPCAGARRIEEDEIGARHVAHPLLDCGVDPLGPRRVDLSAAMRDRRSLHSNHPLKELDQRNGEESDAGVEIDRPPPRRRG